MRALLVSVLMLAAAACGEVLPQDGSVMDGGVDSGSDASPVVRASMGACRLPNMRAVGRSAREFCIDATEVTNAAYDAFAAVFASPVDPPPECAWKTTHVRDKSSSAVDDHPVAGVDWCDAEAFCRHTGKRLCRMREWSDTCTGYGVQAYSYGPVERTEACSPYAESTAPVASKASCQGAFEGVYDMLGNVYEWTEDACVLGSASDPADDKCTLLGTKRCEDATNPTRHARFPMLGLRCCSDD